MLLAVCNLSGKTTSANKNLLEEVAKGISCKCSKKKKWVNDEQTPKAKLWKLEVEQKQCFTVGKNVIINRMFYIYSLL